MTYNTRNTLERKRRELNEIKSRLKTHFVGIDDQIDNLISKIQVWYSDPSLLEKPTIINMWGMTGVGKTDLVKKLVTELRFFGNYIEYNLKDSLSHIRSLRNVVMNSGTSVNDKCILLLDEFQNFRKDGIDSGSLWDFIGDGILYSDQDRYDELLHFYERFTTLKSNASDFGEKAYLPDYELVVLSHYLTLSKEDIEMMIKTRMASSMRDMYLFQNEFENQNTVFLMYIMDKIKEKKKITTPADIMNLMMNSRNHKDFLRALTLDELIFLVNYKLNNLTTKVKVNEKEGENVYSKLLVFVCGNLDKVFKSSVEIEKTSDADKIREQTKKITMSDIKKGLLEFLKPEEIGRLGNNHIVYYGVSKDTYLTLIKRELDRTFQSIQDKYGIEFVYKNNNVMEMIYDEYVYPVQGVRQIFSIISSITSAFVPEYLFKAKELKLDKIDIVIQKIDDKIHICCKDDDRFESIVIY